MNADIVIVGAGAAGIAAGRRLADAGHRALLLEARNRVGGRAWTDTASFGMPIDMGCAWLHSADRNPWTPYAREHGFEIIEELPDWGRRIGREDPSAQQLAAFAAAYERFEQTLADARVRGLDVPVSDLLPDDRFRPRFDAIVSWVTSCDSARVSSLDYANYSDSGIDWAVKPGLGSVVAHAAGPLDVHLNAPVREIDALGSQIRLITDIGTVEARAVIITVPTNVLAAQSIRFRPALPPAFADAVNGVPLGVANKVFFEMQPGTLPFAGTTHFLSTDSSARVASYAVRPAQQELLLAFFGGSFAAELEQRRELETFARAELDGLFGAQFSRQIVRGISTGWGGDPWSLGAYSAALPGKAHLRLQLCEPLHDRIFYASEACSVDYFGTILGAWHSGVAAAERALAVIGSRA